jgi:hypothetical protein
MIAKHLDLPSLFPAGHIALSGLQPKPAISQFVVQRSVLPAKGKRLDIMKFAFTTLALMLASSTYACGSDEYEKCVSGCLVPNPTGGCIQGYKDCKCLPKIGGDVGKVGEAAKEAAGQVINETVKVGNDVLTTATTAAGDTVRTLQKAAGDTVTTVEKATGDTVTTVVKAGNDVVVNYTKAWKDTAEQTRKSLQDTVDAGRAITNFSVNQLKSAPTTLSNAEKRLREGKVVDAMWGLSIEPLQATEQNFATATQESQLIATAAASAAAVYGGPGGAAAYAAWSTYRATGNVEQALRAGLLAAATTQAGGAVSQMPSGTMGEVLKKSAMAGAAGGIAVAAAGGDEQAILDGFLKSGATVLVQAGTDKAKSFAPDAKDAWDTVHCISARDVDCLSKTTWAKDAQGRILTGPDGKPRIDPKKLDPQYYIGNWSQIDTASPQGKLLAAYTAISRLPNADAIPLMKNQWVLTWTAGKTPTMQYGAPSVVLTYVGPNPPFTSQVLYNGQLGGSGATPPLPTTQATSSAYACTIGTQRRWVTTTTKGKGCESIYKRQDGTQQIVWHSNHFPSICVTKAAEFVAKIAEQGISCKRQ